ncbi:MAG: hypothetical protein EHM85_08185 [Desulfobacteraceae bacterium]|nr:MAG: hypothetical protein EHM85_08185 [Desulfobacteraceae bacterium]
MSNKIYINGRPDGIGNRLEELLRIEYHCILNKLTCCYYWDNNGSYNRRYPILFECINVTIQDKNKYPVNMINEVGWMSNRDQMIVAVKNVKLIKPLDTDNCEYTGVHIRTGDRIRNPVPHADFMDINLFNRIFKFTVKQINLEKPKYLFICSDNEKYKNRMISKLDKDIKVVDPLISKSGLQVYDDFYALSQSNKIYMCSKFSSFAITASILNNIPVVSFFDENDSNLIRYYANVIVVNLPERNKYDILVSTIFDMLRSIKRLFLRARLFWKKT